MNRTRKLAAAVGITAAVSLSAIGAAFASENGFTTLPYTDQQEAEQKDALSAIGQMVPGTIKKLENGQIQVTSSDPSAVFPEIILNITDETRILDGAEGFPVDINDIADGEFVYAYTASFMTMSLPPMSNATTIICKVPADMAAPEFEIIKSAQMADDGKSTVITTADGDVFTVDSESTLLPYLTRNMIFLDSLEPGKAVLVWKTEEGLREVGPGVPQSRASKVVLFPEDYSI